MLNENSYSNLIDLPSDICHIHVSTILRETFYPNFKLRRTIAKIDKPCTMSPKLFLLVASLSALFLGCVKNQNSSATSDLIAQAKEYFNKNMSEADKSPNIIVRVYRNFFSKQIIAKESFS